MVISISWCGNIGLDFIAWPAIVRITRFSLERAFILDIHEAASKTESAAINACIIMLAHINFDVKNPRII